MTKPLEELQDEIIGRLHAGERVDRNAIIARHPEHAAALAQFFEVIRVIEEPPPGPEPTRLGEFTIVRELGHGGMGVVYEAEQASLKRRVALKILPPALGRDPTLVARFRREAEAAGRLRHPNIVPVFSVGEAAGTPFFAMELVEGPSLADVVKRRRDGEDDASLPARGAPWRRWAVEIAARIAEALAYAHDQGILHRDVKPANIILAPGGAPRLTDFGLALDLGAAALTRSGESFGTPQYMSPEQLARREEPVDARTDVYSLAVTLYELLTLRLPYDADSTPALLSAVQRGQITRPRRVDPEIDPALERVLLRALRVDPGERYGTAREFAADLQAILEDRAPAPLPRRRGGARRRVVVAVAAVVLVAAGAAVWGLRRPRPIDVPTAADWVRLVNGEIADPEATLLRWLEPEVRLRRYFARSQADPGYWCSLRAALAPGGEPAPPVLVIVKWEVTRGRGDPAIGDGKGDWRPQGYGWVIANDPKRRTSRRSVKALSHTYPTYTKADEQHLTHIAKYRALLLPEGFGDGKRVEDFFKGPGGVRATWTSEQTVKIVDRFPDDYPAAVADDALSRALATAGMAVTWRSNSPEFLGLRVGPFEGRDLPIAARIEAVAPDGTTLGQGSWLRRPWMEDPGTGIVRLAAPLAGVERVRIRLVGDRDIARNNSDFEEYWDGSVERELPVDRVTR